MIVYASQDNGELYLESEVDVDPITKEAHGYTRYEILETVTLTAQQCCGGYGDILEILSNARLIKQV